MPEPSNSSPPFSGPPDVPTALTDLARKFQQSADNTDFQRLFSQSQGPLRRFFRRLKYSPEEAEDLTQNVLLGVYKNIGGFRFESRFETWMYKIATNEWKNDVRRRQTLKRQAQEVPVDPVSRSGAEGDQAIELTDPAAGPLERLLALEQTERLHLLLQELPPRVRQCLLLRLERGLKYREIAAALRLSMTTVKTHILHGYQRLRHLLEHQSRVLEAQEPPG